jgi:phage gp29-like protein
MGTKPAPRVDLSERKWDRTLAEIVTNAPTQDMTIRRLGNRMTPEAVEAAVRSADRGYMQPYCDMLTEQRAKVTHLHGVLSVRELAIAGCRWQILPAQVKRGKSKAKAIADYVDARYQAIPRLSDHIHHLAGGLYHGRSALETEFFRDAKGIGIKGFSPIHPRRLSYTDGFRLHVYDATGNTENPELARLPGLPLDEQRPGKFVAYSARTTGAEYPNRQGLGSHIIFANLFWIWTTRQWMQLAEKHADPWRVAMLAEDASDATVADVRRCLIDMTSSGIGVFPHGVTVDLLDVPNAGTFYKDLRTAWNAELSKIVLGQTGTTELGDVGSYSATKVMDLVRGDIKTADGKSISEAFEECSIRPLVAMQFGDAAAEEYCPSFELITKGEEDVKAEFLRWTELVDRGVPMDANASRERYSPLKEPKQGAILAFPKGKQLSLPGSEDATDPAADPASAEDKADPKAKDKTP